MEIMRDIMVVVVEAWGIVMLVGVGKEGNYARTQLLSCPGDVCVCCVCRRGRDLYCTTEPF